MVLTAASLHDRIKLNAGTVLIHAGDVTEYGSEEEVVDFLFWFSRQPFAYKIFIGGNHDLFLETSTPAQRKKLIPSNVIYLQNSGIEIDGLMFWGSPVTPYFLGMAFNAREGKERRKVWNKIPHNTDILITHGPPK
jgi:predicted phosphohydrolase